MLANVTKTVNATAQSVSADGQSVIVTYSGYVDNNLQPTVNRVIRSTSEYKANREEYDKEYEQFTDYVMSFITD